MTPPSVDHENLGEVYDRRYEGDYMLGDAFARWSHAGVELQRVKDILGCIPSGEIGSILDYGCGQGEWIESLSEAFPSARVAGVDISRIAIRKAGLRRPGTEFRWFDGQRAPFGDQTFDLVFSYHVLEHVLHIEEVVADMARLVRRGGYLCVIFPCGNPGSFEERLVARIDGGVERGPGGRSRFFFEDSTHLRRMRSAEIVDLFRQNGAEVRTEYYAHQLFGAVEWIAKSGRRFAREMFDARRAVSLRARGELMVSGTIMSCLALLHDLSTVDPSKPRAAWKKALLHALLPVGLFGRAVSRGLERLARLEWARFRLRKNGSEQFLLFQKQPGSRPE